MRKIMLLVAATALVMAACGDDAGAGDAGDATEASDQLETGPQAGSSDAGGDTAVGGSGTAAPATEPGDSQAPGDSTPVGTLPDANGDDGSEDDENQETTIVPGNPPTTNPPAPPEGKGDPSDLTPVPGVSPVEPPVPGVIDAGLQPQIDVAVADLAQRLAIQVSDIGVIRAEFIVWPDSSVGCPQPGMAYLQVLTEGAIVDLASGGASFSYHSGGGLAPFLCEKTR